MTDYVVLVLAQESTVSVIFIYYYTMCAVPHIYYTQYFERCGNVAGEHSVIHIHLLHAIFIFTYYTQYSYSFTTRNIHIHILHAIFIFMFLWYSTQCVLYYTFTTRNILSGVVMSQESTVCRQWLQTRHRSTSCSERTHR